MNDFAAWIHGGGPDPLYREAIAAVVKHNRGSISTVQRVLKIGYNRAARFIEQMEHEGLVSAPDYRGDRKVLPAAKIVQNETTDDAGMRLSVAENSRVIDKEEYVGPLSGKAFGND